VTQAAFYIPSSKFLKAVVTWRRDLTPNLWIVRVRPERPVPFKAGQYVALGLPGASKMIERAYSIVSAPHETELEFFFELVPNGELTPRLYQIPVGGEVYMRPSAKGLFLMDEASGNQNHFMVATVTGVVPYVSMVRDLAWHVGEEKALAKRLLVIEGASFSSELGYEVELAETSRERNWLQYLPTVSRAWLDSTWRGERGRAEDVVRKYLDSYGWTASDTTAYLCGNPVMIENVRGILTRAGFPSGSIREEMFWVA
jgi:ferredoxin--NADP+ reductase